MNFDVSPKYLKETQLTTEMEKLAKDYPGISNGETMKLPRLDKEVFQAVDQKCKNLDWSLQAIQKGLLGAMAAFAPVLELAFARGSADKELAGLSRGVMDGLK